MVKLFQSIIKLYAALISPILGRNCRFHPTCSAYAHESLEKHGIFKGIYLMIRRILSCHPWSKKNYRDPVPERFAWKHILGYKRLDRLQTQKVQELEKVQNRQKVDLRHSKDTVNTVKTDSE